MIDKAKILFELENDFNRLKTKHTDHLLRVSEAIDWFRDHCIDTQKENGDDFLNHVVRYKKCDCTVIYVSFRGIPFFDCYFVVYPLKSKDDIGSGKGVAVKIEF